MKAIASRAQGEVAGALALNVFLFFSKLCCSPVGFNGNICSFFPPGDFSKWRKKGGTPLTP